MKPYPGYPKNLRDGFPGIPNNVDTAFVWSGNGKIYFFKDNQYWKFDPQKQPHVRSDQYPKVETSEMIDIWPVIGQLFFLRPILRPMIGCV